jgi:hypothetical protein
MRLSPQAAGYAPTSGCRWAPRAILSMRSLFEVAERRGGCQHGDREHEVPKGGLPPLVRPDQLSLVENVTLHGGHQLVLAGARAQL